MIINIAYIVVFFIEMLISYMFFSDLSERKTSLLAILGIGTVLFEIGAVINILLISTAWLNALYSVIANFLFSIICFHIKPIRSIFYSILLIAVSTFLEVISVFIISSVTQLYVSDSQSNPIQLVIEIVISKAVYFIFVMVISRFVKEGNKRIKIPMSFYVHPIVSMISAISFWYIGLNERLEHKSQLILAVISFLLFLSTIFLFFAFQYNAQRENKLLLLQQEQDKIKTNKLYYDILEKQNDNLRIYAHDAKNHLSAIKSLNTNPQINTYISKMLERLSEYSNVCHSGNRILDVIIDKYITECKINNITFDYDIKNNNLSNIEYYDAVTILGNLLDNAVEAVEKTGIKHISLETDFRNNFSVIIISNSCENNPMFENETTLITTKENVRLHGFGLKSVKKAIKKYNGDIAFDYDPINKIFIVTVMIEN